MKRKQLSKKTRFEVLRRDKFTCQYCGRKVPDIQLQMDHVIPFSAGGNNEMENLVSSCPECNAGKGISGGAKLTGRELKHIKYILQQSRHWKTVGLEYIAEILYRGCREDEEHSRLTDELQLRISECVDHFGLLETARVAAIAVGEQITRDDFGGATQESVELAVYSLYSNLLDRICE